MKVALLLIATFVVLLDAATPATSYGTVTQNDIAAASISSDKLQSLIIDRKHLKDYSVTNSKLASFSVSDRVLQQNAVTSRSLAVDFVRIHGSVGDPIGFSNGGDINILTPLGIFPNGVANNADFSDANSQTLQDYDFPDASTRYVLQGTAKGTGIILGYYPNQNGHLLRYESGRALRQLNCYEVTYTAYVTSLSPIIGNNYCYYCDYNNIYSSYTYQNGYSTDNVQVVPSITVNGQTGQTLTTSTPGCEGDSFCEAFDALANSAESCRFTTSAGSPSYPAQGIPIYSPSIERVMIDDYGVVSVYLFGAGSDTGLPADIDITVAVLLNNQYGQ